MIFARHALESGWMTAGEWVIYQHVIKAMETKMDLYVWLSTRPDECMRRIERRNRREDDTLTME